ncbi:hypothetical protein EVG20_g2205 [Dentipellis fragilis]|uniref:Uncharacterized protein n=1 Tax=Dentipellis fragilis TaxID=205917 RepID=A0A4Y9Z8M8_9AGAM|nr:hypothetical protein EVG20_g2205 [Dentipellis fragilis]
MANNIYKEHGSTPSTIINMFAASLSTEVGFGDQCRLRDYSYDHFVFAIPGSHSVSGRTESLPTLMHRPIEAGLTSNGLQEQASNDLGTTGGMPGYTLPLCVQAVMSTGLVAPAETTQPTGLNVQNEGSTVTHEYTVEALNKKHSRTQAIDLGNQHSLGLSTNRYLPGSWRGPSAHSRTAEPRRAKRQRKDKSRRPRSKIPPTSLAPICATRIARHACPHSDSKKYHSRTKDARQYKWQCRRCQNRSERRDLVLYESWERANEEVVFLFCGRDASELENKEGA